MSDTLSSEERSERMRRIRGKHTKVELTVRKLIHAMGYRYRLHAQGLPGRPDVVFPGRRKVIFVHGCFWHRHADPACSLARLPKSRLDFWQPKLEANRQRDQTNRERLVSMGWDPLIIWECELKNIDLTKSRIREFLESEIEFS